ncbi:MAG: ornithine carbamoyltransferase [SAR324 cluster bacterium]|uniref:Ornithine carbamoyltransferase n=1 Tax=SAR324 cluster bacterium TaxID=2024889 RepID=A0A2A4T3A2_9DELT|nr:MAG: ornithine carbamoyltransferase [SAR324 cluster bacterium]
MEKKAIKHLISWKDWADQDLRKILELARKVKLDPLRFQGHLTAKTLIMLFQKTSTRTRVSFEAGMTEMGGHAIFLDWHTTNFNLTEIGYESAYLSTNSHIMMARVKKHEELLELKEWATVPLINGCCNKYHPCQAMADMLTIYMDRGSMEGAKLTYLGVHNNVVNSLMATCAAFGVELTLVCPLTPEGAVDEEIKQKIVDKGLLVETLDQKAAVKDADYVYTDTWIDMEFFSNPDFKAMKEERIKLMLPYQINETLMKDSSAKIMHDMPIHPGYEIAAELVKHPNSIIFEQSSNRLPAQKAIMLTLLNEI